MSVPLMTSVPSAPLLPGVDWCCVIMPSISTSMTPFTDATINTRTSGMGALPLTANSVCSGEDLPSAKVSWKPLKVLPAVTVIFTSCSASSTVCGAGTGTPGPIINWSLIPPNMFF